MIHKYTKRRWVDLKREKLRKQRKNTRKKAYHQRKRLIKEQTPKNEGSGSIPFSGLQSLTLVLLSRKLASRLIQYPYLLSYLLNKTRQIQTFPSVNKRQKRNQKKKKWIGVDPLLLKELLLRSFDSSLMPDRPNQKIPFFPNPHSQQAYPVSSNPPALTFFGMESFLVLSPLIPLVLPALSHSSSAPSNIIYDWLFLAPSLTGALIRLFKEGVR